MALDQGNPKLTSSIRNGEDANLQSKTKNLHLQSKNLESSHGSSNVSEKDEVISGQDENTTASSSIKVSLALFSNRKKKDGEKVQIKKRLQNEKKLLQNDVMSNEP